MSFRTSLLVTADAAQAKGEMRATQAEARRTTEAAVAIGAGAAGAAGKLDALGASSRRAANSAGQMRTALQQTVDRMVGLDRATNSAEASAKAMEAEIARSERAFHELRSAIDPTYRASKQYEAAVEAATAAVRAGVATQSQANAVMAAAETQYLSMATGARNASAANAGAAAQVGNLAAQFNDIGVMLAAGQNPLQLALQQGTQITQVIGPMGAAGAVRMLGGAFMSLINPVSLVTIGVIAAGAALVGMAADAWPATKSVAEAVDEAAEAADRLNTVSRLLASDGLDTLRGKYGEVTAEVRALIAAQKEQAEAAARRNLTSLQGSLGEGFSDAFNGMQDAFEQIENPLDQLGSERRGYRILERRFGLARREADALSAALAQALSAERPDEIAKSMRTVHAIIRDTVGGVENLNEEQAQWMAQLLEAESAARQVAAVDMVDPVRRAAAEASRLADEITRAMEAAQDLSTSGARRMEDAQLRLELADDPVELARQLAVREMRRAQAPIRAESDGREIAYLDAQAEAYGRVAAQAAAADEARRKRLQAQRGADRSDRGQRQALEALIVQEQAQLAILRETDPVQQELIRNSRALAVATAAEAAQVEDLIRARLDASDRAAARQVTEGLQTEIELLRELDPVQRQMIRLRAELSGATAAERGAVEELIAEREREAAAARSAAQMQEAFGDIAFDALDRLILQGGKLSDVFDDVASMLAKAALQAAVLGTGPLAGLLGTAGGGGVVGLLGTAIQGFIGGGVAPTTLTAQSSLGPIYADGGIVHGPGGGRTDDVQARLSQGEFVVNASATRRWRHVLERINGGAVPGQAPAFAAGGFMGGGAAAQPVIQPVIEVVNQSSTPVSAREDSGTDAGGRRRTRLVLADAVGDALTTPGGGARRAMRGQFGIKPRGTMR